MNDLSVNMLAGFRPSKEDIDGVREALSQDVGYPVDLTDEKIEKMAMDLFRLIEVLADGNKRKVVGDGPIKTFRNLPKT